MSDEPSEPPGGRRTVPFVAPDAVAAPPSIRAAGSGSTRATLAPGRLFAERYTIQDPLGRGGMGDVYRARDERLQRDVALKRLHAAHEGDERVGAARLLREARAAAAIDHPSVARVFDAGEADGVPYIVMELLTGETLRDHVTASSLSLPARLGVLLDVARGLTAAHARGIAHRDVKPENVMVKRDGSAKVLDFGIARTAPALLLAHAHAHAPDGSSAPPDAPPLGTLTAEGIVMGTADYMAPEQLRGEPPDARSDQFAWGVVAYEVLSGARPWSHGGAPPTVSDVLTHAPEPLGKRAPGVAGEVSEAVMRALAIAPADRFPSMEDVVNVMARAVEARPTRTSGAPIAAAGRPHPRRFAVGAAVIVLATIAGAASLVARRAHPLLGSPAAPAAPDARAPQVRSVNPQARAEYQAAMQAFHDGAVESARASFEKAAELDPALGAAHLRAVLTDPSVDPGVRLHGQRALELRAGLDERDRVLLDAFMPWLAIPKDPPEAERRLALAAARAPDDAELSYHLCRMRLIVGEYARAIPACDQALRADPTLAPALRMKGLNQTSMGDVAGAERTYAACLDASPAATACLADRLEIQMAEGECRGAVQTSRRIVALAPDEARSYQRLAEALLGAGEPVESVRAAVTRLLDRTPDDEREEAEMSWNAALALYAGDFAEAERQLLASQRLLAGSSEEKAQVTPLFGRWNVAFETGEARRAGALAADFLKRRAGWTPHDYMDVGLYAHDVRYQTGALSRRDFARIRDAWLAAEEQRPASAGQVGAPASLRWLIAYATPAATRADAEEALAALPAYLPLPGPVTRTPEFDDALGMVYLRAGRPRDAVSTLSRASRSAARSSIPWSRWSRWRTSVRRSRPRAIAMAPAPRTPPSSRDGGTPRRAR